MAKSLLFKNDDAITEEKKFVNTVLPYLQDVANELTALNLVFTIDNIKEITFQVKNRQGIKGVTEFVTNMLVDSVSTPQIGNLPISKEKLKSIIEIPNCETLLQSIEQLLNNSFNGYNQTVLIMYGYYFTVNAGTVSKILDVDTFIEEKNCYYSENANQIELFNKINDFAAACNAMETYLKARNVNVDKFRNIEELDIITKAYGTTWKPSYTYITRNIK
jgi:hypothetical protein